MTDDELSDIVQEEAARSGCGGLEIGTMYGDFALEVAKAVRERCAKICDAVADEVSRRDQWSVCVPWEAETIGVYDGAIDCANRIRKS